MRPKAGQPNARIADEVLSDARMDATFKIQDSGSLKPWAFGLAVLGLLLVVFPKVMLGIESFVYRDYGVLGYPFVQYHRDCFWRGEFPLWNPYSNCGAPFMAQWGTMTLYPGSLIYLLLPLPWSLSFFCFVHLALGGAGMFALARRWTGSQPGAIVAGLGFVFCGTTFSCLMWPNYMVALGWMPWVVLLAERSWREGGRGLVAAALAAALQLLAGVPELVALTWLLLAGLCVTEAWGERGARWRMIRRFATVVLLVAGLAAVQLLPFLELLEHSQRDRNIASSKWPMPLWGFANLLVPLFHFRETAMGPFVQPNQGFFSSYYPGAAILVLAVCAVKFAPRRRVWVLAGLVLVSLLMACGENGFLYPLVKNGVPLLGVARYPIKFVLLAAFALPLLAAFAMRELEQRDEQATRRRRWVVFVGAGALALMGLLAWLSWSHPWQSSELSARDNAVLAQWEWRDVVPNAAARAVWLVVALGALVASLRLAVPRARHAALGLLVAALVTDAATHVPVQNPTAPAAALAAGLWREVNKTELPRLGEGRVLISPGAEQRLLYSTATNATQDFLAKRIALWSNLNLLERAPKVNGSSTLQLRGQAQVQSLVYGGSNKFHRGLIEMLGVTLYSAPDNPAEWRRATNALPLVSCGQAVVFADAAETLRALAGPDFDPRAQMFLRPEDRRLVNVTNPSSAQVRGMNFSAHAIEVEVEAASPTLVFVSQSHHPAWRAYLNGNETPLLRANHAFQALEVPAGRHQVRIEYRDRRFLAGAIVSLLTLAGCGWSWRRKRGATGATALVMPDDAARKAA